MRTCQTRPTIASLHYVKAAIYLTAVLVFVGNASAKIIYVNDDASLGGDGTSWETAKKYLQNALASANEGDEIRVAEGSYRPDQGSSRVIGDRSASFELGRGVNLYGGYKGIETTQAILGEPEKTILSGEINPDQAHWSQNILMGNDIIDAILIDGFLITKGNSNNFSNGSPKGGGIYLENSSLTFRNCTFRGNSAFYGGSAYIVKSSPNFIRCIFAANTVKVSGGGIYNENSSTNFLDCVFTDNIAGVGGGAMSNYNSSPTLTNCIFADNVALANGGGMENSASSPSLVNCVFTTNSAKVGGSLFNHLESSPTLTNSIFWRNTTNEIHGHGIFTEVGSSWNIVDVLSEFAFVPNIAEGWSGDGRATSADPLFIAHEDPDGPDDKWFTADDGLHLSQGSPAIDMGSEAHLTEGDLHLDAIGSIRSQGDAIDLGPYEHGNAYPSSWTLAKDHGAGWKSYDWFGLYYVSSGNWLYHEKLHWIYRNGVDINSLWLWHQNLGWLWTSRANFPYLWHHDQGAWLYFSKETSSANSLYSFSQSKWLSP